jgi:uncharacterized BrkB/YihY/UPF0761 family membrane protein
MRNVFKIAILVSFVVFIIATAIHSYLFASDTLVEYGRIALFVMILSIFFGFATAFYFLLSSRPLFDPLDSMLDEDPKNKRKR